jgi:hypothetical protein
MTATDVDIIVRAVCHEFGYVTARLTMLQGRVILRNDEEVSALDHDLIVGYVAQMVNIMCDEVVTADALYEDVWRALIARDGED